MILPCTCEHKFQDVEYGQDNRVHNYAPKGHRGNAGWRCVVCLDMKAANTAMAKRGSRDSGGVE